MAPTLLPVDVAAFKLHHKVDIDDEDTSIEDYITAAADYAEGYQNRCWRLSTWQAMYDCFPDSGVFYMPRPPLVSATITYYDVDGVSQTLATTYYTVDTISEPGRIALKYSQSWPSTLDQIGSVTITFVAGCSSASDIPARTRQAIRMLVSHWYENKEPIAVGQSVANVPLSVMDLLDQDRLLSYR